jgi:universal stress protein F
VTVRTVARHGTVYEEILDTADELGIDQIVMTAQRPSMKDYLLGANAAKVVRYAKCSVNIIRRLA